MHRRLVGCAAAGTLRPGRMGPPQARRQHAVEVACPTSTHAPLRMVIIALWFLSAPLTSALDSALQSASVLLTSALGWAFRFLSAPLTSALSRAFWSLSAPLTSSLDWALRFLSVPLTSTLDWVFRFLGAPLASVLGWAFRSLSAPLTASLGWVFRLLSATVTTAHDQALQKAGFHSERLRVCPHVVRPRGPSGPAELLHLPRARPGRSSRAAPWCTGLAGSWRGA